MKRLLLLFIVIINYSFAFENIQSLEAIVKEKTSINGEKKEKLYSLKIEMPDKVLKEMILPKLNKGEKFLYTGEKKTVFYPLLEQIIEEEITDDENYILKAIKKIKEGKNNIKNSSGLVSSVKLDEQLTVKFYKYIENDGVNFPKIVKVFDGENLVSEIYFEKYIINKKFDKKEFSIE